MCSVSRVAVHSSTSSEGQVCTEAPMSSLRRSTGRQLTRSPDHDVPACHRPARIVIALNFPADSDMSTVLNIRAPATPGLACGLLPCGERCICPVQDAGGVVDHVAHDVGGGTNVVSERYRQAQHPPR